MDKQGFMMTCESCGGPNIDGSIRHVGDCTIFLKQQNALLSKQAASMSNTLADYASKINSLAHYIIDNKNSTSEAVIYADEALDFIVSRLESR